MKEETIRLSLVIKTLPVSGFPFFYFNTALRWSALAYFPCDRFITKKVL